MKSLFELYFQHKDKVSDKWTLYLAEYDRLFHPYRNSPVSLLEIGIQNGGSLEIWGKYFLDAERIIGCDINEACAQLSFDDTRTQVIVGDANTDSVHTKIKSLSPSFDIVIDDGSHTSSDIVKSFGRYFPEVKYGGIFIAEDIHCSYWQEYEGGLFYPYSSIAFFKRLADIINHEHWRVDRQRSQILAGFRREFGINFDEMELQSIHSVEFINSMCVVRKQLPAENSLGTRFIAGQNEVVVPGHLGLSGTAPIGFSQTTNPWSTMALPPDEDWSQMAREISERQAEISLLHQNCSHMEKELSERDVQIHLLQQTSEDLNRIVEQLKQDVSTIESSRSWKITAPLRALARVLSR